MDMTCPTEDNLNKVHEITYKNWRGKTSLRKVIIKSFRFGTTEWHKEPGWLMRAWDVEKQAEREFALADCDFLSNREGL
jgi:hypothetical protein